MKHTETLLLELRVSDNRALIARRKDGQRLTDDDRAEARKLAKSPTGNHS
jgi:hypothetical protein